jgi:hypothetical protein
MGLSNMRRALHNILIEKLFVSLNKWVHNKLHKHFLAVIAWRNFCDLVGSIWVKVELIPHKLNQYFRIHTNFFSHIWNKSWKSKGPTIIARRKRHVSFFGVKQTLFFFFYQLIVIVFGPTFKQISFNQFRYYSIYLFNYLYESLVYHRSIHASINY